MARRSVSGRGGGAVSRATRLRISAEFLSVDRLRVQVSDLGFGELFPSSDLTWSEEVDLGGR